MSNVWLRMSEHVAAYLRTCSRLCGEVDDDAAIIFLPLSLPLSHTLHRRRAMCGCGGQNERR